MVVIEVNRDYTANESDELKEYNGMEAYMKPM